MKEIKVDVSYDKDCEDVCFTITDMVFNHNNLMGKNTLMFFLPKAKADELSFKTGSAIQDMERFADKDLHPLHPNNI